MTMKKNAKSEVIKTFEDLSKSGTAPVSELGIDKGNRSGAPSLRYPSDNEKQKQEDKGQPSPTTNKGTDKQQPPTSENNKPSSDSSKQPSVNANTTDANTSNDKVNEKPKDQQQQQQQKPADDAKKQELEQQQQQKEKEAREAEEKQKQAQAAAEAKAAQEQKEKQEAEARQKAIEEESKKSMTVEGDTKLTDTSSDAQKKHSEVKVTDAEKDKDGVTHYDGTNNKGTTVQYNGALNSSLLIQETESGTLYNRFKYRASDTYAKYANGNVSPPFGGSRLAENEAQPYHVMSIDNYEFGIGVVDNPGGSQKASTTVKLAQTQPDGSVNVTVGLPNSAQAVLPSLWFAVSLADLSNKDKFDVKKFTDEYVIGFEVAGDGNVTSNFIGEFAYNPNWVTLATNMAGKGGKKVYNAPAMTPATKDVSRPFQGYVGILDSKENVTKTFPNNPYVYWPEASYPYSKGCKYAMPYGKFKVKMYATRRATGETYELTFPVNVNFNPKAS